MSCLPREHGFEPLRIEGRVPDDLRGTVYRNGPMLLQNHGEPYEHLFDGDGGLCAVRFDGEGALGAARVTETDGLQRERAARRRLYGGFGSVQPGLLRRLFGKLKNTANTGVLFWRGRLFALMEAARPVELCPESLSALGETDLEGVIPRSFSAHPIYVPSREATYNFGVRYGRRTLLDVFELPDRGRPRRLASVPLPGPTLIHAAAVTERHLVVFAPPLRLAILDVILGRKSYAGALRWRPELGTEVIVVPLDEPEQTVRFSTEAFFQWHFANAFDRGSEIVVDVVRYRDFESNDWLGGVLHGREASGVDGYLHRAVISPARRSVTFEERCPRPCELPRTFPRVATRPYRYCYVSANANGRFMPHDALARIDVETGERSTFPLEPGQTTGEPILVPRPGARDEEDGYLLASIYDARAHASHCAVFDARDLEAGPLCRAHFDHHVPLRIHGDWLPAES